MRGIDCEDNRTRGCIIDRADSRGVKDGLFKVFLCCDLLRTENEGVVFASEDSQWMGSMCEVTNENTCNSYCTEKGANIGEIMTRSPINNSLNTRFIG